MASLVTEVDICRVRADTFPFTVTVTSDGTTAINITGNTYLLTVDPQPNPPDATANLFQMIGVVTDGPNGIVTFTLTGPQSDQTPGVYYYDVQQTSGGVIRTILRGAWEVVQDITK